MTPNATLQRIPKLSPKKHKSIARAELLAAMEEADRLITFLNVFDLMIFDDLGRALPKERLVEVMPKFQKTALILRTIAMHLDNIHRYTCVTAGTNPREIIFERGLNHENIPQDH